MKNITSLQSLEFFLEKGPRILELSIHNSAAQRWWDVDQMEHNWSELCFCTPVHTDWATFDHLWPKLKCLSEYGY